MTVYTGYSQIIFGTVEIYLQCSMNSCEYVKPSAISLSNVFPQISILLIERFNIKYDQQLHLW